jgi:hypothetical protein
MACVPAGAATMSPLQTGTIVSPNRYLPPPDTMKNNSSYLRFHNGNRCPSVARGVIHNRFARQRCPEQHPAELAAGAVVQIRSGSPMDGELPTTQFEFLLLDRHCRSAVAAVF